MLYVKKVGMATLVNHMRLSYSVCLHSRCGPPIIAHYKASLADAFEGERYCLIAQGKSACN